GGAEQQRADHDENGDRGYGGRNGDATAGGGEVGEVVLLVEEAGPQAPVRVGGGGTLDAEGEQGQQQQERRQRRAQNAARVAEHDGRGTSTRFRAPWQAAPLRRRDAITVVESACAGARPGRPRRRRALDATRSACAVRCRRGAGQGASR